MMKKNDSCVVKRKTIVIWDINGCPIPENYDASLIGAKIDTALMKSGYSSGPLTIYAIGDLGDYSDEVLRALSSAGIHLKERNCRLSTFQATLHKCILFDESPATVMLLSSADGLMSMADDYLEKVQKKKGFNVVVACPDPWPYANPRREKFKELKGTYSDVTRFSFPKGCVVSEYVVVDDDLEEEMYDYATRLGGSRMDNEWPSL